MRAMHSAVQFQGSPEPKPHPEVPQHFPFPLASGTQQAGPAIRSPHRSNMPRKKAARNTGETSGSEDPADILATAQQKMGTVG